MEGEGGCGERGEGVERKGGVEGEREDGKERGEWRVVEWGGWKERRRSGGWEGGGELED